MVSSGAAASCGGIFIGLLPCLASCTGLEVSGRAARSATGPRRVDACCQSILRRWSQMKPCMRVLSAAQLCQMCPASMPSDSLVSTGRVDAPMAGKRVLCQSGGGHWKFVWMHLAYASCWLPLGGLRAAPGVPYMHAAHASEHRFDNIHTRSSISRDSQRTSRIRFRHAFAHRFIHPCDGRQ